MYRYLAEKMTFDQLFRMSEPKRVFRSYKVKGPPLEIDSYQDTVYYSFNFKSFPSTTGLRHRGYVKFLKPRYGGQKPLQHLDCVVDCTCPDFRYRWAWVNKQRGASRVGAQSLNQSLNRAPRITNPKSRPGLCKHVLAAREYIYGLLSSFPSDEPDTAEKLNKLTRFAQKRWANMPAQMQAARDREQRIAAARNARNAGQPVPAEAPEQEPAGNVPADDEREPGDEEGYEEVVPPEIADAPELNELPAPPKSYAAGIKPPSQRGRSMPSYAAPSKPASKDVRRLHKGTPDKASELSKKSGFNSPAAYNFSRRQGLGDSLDFGNEKTKTNCVVMTNLNGMNVTLTEARRLISELEQDELASLKRPGRDDQGGPEGPGGPESLPPGGGEGGDAMGDEMGGGDLPPGGMGDEMGGGDLPPSEPPVSDSAVGADTGASAALGLLGEIRDFLGQLASVIVPEPTGEEMGGDGGEEGDGEELEIPVGDPTGEAESEDEGDEDGESRAEEEEDEDREMAAKD